MKHHADSFFNFPPPAPFFPSHAQKKTLNHLATNVKNSSFFFVHRLCLFLTIE
jgi:hypothetical protein